MISFMADVIGIRDDMYIGKGHTYMQAVADAVEEGFQDGVLEQRPTLVNLQCDIDHPTQVMADTLHLIHHFGGVDQLRGKKVAMTWAYSPSYGKPLSVPQGVIGLIYSPSYGKPLSVPQGVIGLMTRFGMDVVLAHPEGYEIMPEVEEVARANAQRSGGSYRRVTSMDEAFEGADIVYPKSWAPYAAMEKRTDLYTQGESGSSWPRTPSTRTGAAPRRAWPGPRPARPSTSTASPPTSPASPARRARWTPRSSTATGCPSIRRPATSPMSSRP